MSGVSHWYTARARRDVLTCPNGGRDRLAMFVALKATSEDQAVLARLGMGDFTDRR